MDDADRAEIEIERAQREAFAAHAVRAHAQQAPLRLASNGARLCLGCGEPLQSSRLIAQPTAARCVDCQGDWERAQWR